MKNFVKLLVIAMAPVLLTSVVNAAKPAPAPDESRVATLKAGYKKQSLDTLKTQFAGLQDRYYRNPVAVYDACVNAATMLQDTLKKVSAAKMISVGELDVIDQSFSTLQGSDMRSYWEWLNPLSTKTDKTLLANIYKMVWPKLSVLDIKPMIPEFYLIPNWLDKEGVIDPNKGTYSVIVSKETKGAKPWKTLKFSGLPLLFDALYTTQFKEMKEAKQIKAPIAISTLLLPIYEALSKIDFLGEVSKLASATSLTDMKAFIKLNEERVALQAEIAEREQQLAKAPIKLATALNMLAD